MGRRQQKTDKQTDRKLTRWAYRHNNNIQIHSGTERVRQTVTKRDRQDRQTDKKQTEG